MHELSKGGALGLGPRCMPVAQKFPLLRCDHFLLEAVDLFAASYLSAVGSALEELLGVGVSIFISMLQRFWLPHTAPIRR